MLNRFAPCSTRATWPLVTMLLTACSVARAAIDREDVVFSINYSTTTGQSVYVVGNIPELGSNSFALAPRLEPSDYPVWKATIAIPKGTTYTYRYIWRNNAVTQWSNTQNGTPITDYLTGATSGGSFCPATKGVLYQSTWSHVVIGWRSDLGAYTEVPLTPYGPGRVDGEQVWRALGIGQGQRKVEFYFTDGGGLRDPSVLTKTYSTTLDAFFVQDGQVFDYVPPATVSAQQQFNFMTFYSAILQETRPYRVLLPRGYVQNTDKRYPVLYMHDGQNVFDMGTFGTWNADETANTMTRAGQMREIIIVGVDNTANRGPDYIPPDDIVPGGFPGAGGPGHADRYAAFLINELKPVIDATYRTYPDRDHTATLGSSLGGLVSLYLGWDFNSVFGRVGPMSGSWQLSNFLMRAFSEPMRDLRIYLDSGDSGTANDNAVACMSVRDGMLQRGMVLERTLRHVVGFGQQHNEQAWAARLPKAYDFLFPATEAENPLRQTLFRCDFDCSGRIDLVDFQQLTPCWHGPENAGCPDTDLDGDGDNDLADFARFATEISG